MKPVQVSVSCGTAEEASAIVEQAVRCRFAAAGQSWPAKSMYWWEGKVVERDEFVVVLKSIDSRVDEIMGLIRSLHSYKVPSIAVTAVKQLGPGVNDWLVRETHANPPLESLRRTGLTTSSAL